MAGSLWKVSPLSAIAAFIALPGCTTFNAMPRAVMAPEDTLAIATGETPVNTTFIKSGKAAPAQPASSKKAEDDVGFGLRDALARALQTGSDTDGSRRRYRDVFIDVQLTAIDGQYRVFRERLAIEAKSTNLGLDLSVLALTGTGAVVGAKAANALSAAGVALTGAKAAFNRELYFDKTLPALIASMDARRLTIRTGIAQRMQQSIDDYPIAAAIADLSVYQDAASLDDAIDQITQAAVDTRDVAKAKYDDAAHVCVAENEVLPIWRAIGTYLFTLKDKVKLDEIAHLVNVTPGTDPDVERRAIRRQIGVAYCSKAAATKLESDISLVTGTPIQ